MSSLFTPSPVCKLTSAGILSFCCCMPKSCLGMLGDITNQILINDIIQVSPVQSVYKHQIARDCLFSAMSMVFLFIYLWLNNKGYYISCTYSPIRELDIWWPHSRFQVVPFADPPHPPHQHKGQRAFQGRSLICEGKKGYPWKSHCFSSLLFPVLTTLQAAPLLGSKGRESWKRQLGVLQGMETKPLLPHQGPWW